MRVVLAALIWGVIIYAVMGFFTDLARWRVSKLGLSSCMIVTITGREQEEKKKE